MSLTKCLNCGRTVLPKEGNMCPSCSWPCDQQVQPVQVVPAELVQASQPEGEVNAAKPPFGSRLLTRIGWRFAVGGGLLVLLYGLGLAATRGNASLAGVPLLVTGLVFTGLGLILLLAIKQVRE